MLNLSTLNRRLLSPFLASAIPAFATSFVQEQFLVPHSVTGNGTALLLQSDATSPMGFLDWPAATQVAGLASLEASSEPLFAGLSQATLGAGHYRYDADTHILAMLGIIGTDGIQSLPLLQGTYEERQNRPELRPVACQECSQLNDQVYLGAINAQRALRGMLPRGGIGSQPIPLTLWSGLTTKYFWEELEGGGYVAQALNLDAGFQLEAAIGYDPVNNLSQRDIIIQVSGFELLPTSQRSEMEGYVKDEEGERRWHVGLSWRELWPSLRSSTLVGITQRTEGNKWPGLAVEGNIKQAFYLRGGFDGQTWASGISLKWKTLSVHYALQKHPLGLTWYQVSIQAGWPD